mmetsp:Transcript_60354/g.160680  ORF Transcript_60354/g.160680 Transcript_60354/m.160680 type:complete len:281 (+) Transcript_60354:370-1212(+)
MTSFKYLFESANFLASVSCFAFSKAVSSKSSLNVLIPRMPQPASFNIPCFFKYSDFTSIESCSHILSMSNPRSLRNLRSHCPARAASSSFRTAGASFSPGTASSLADRDFKGPQFLYVSCFMDRRYFFPSKIPSLALNPFDCPVQDGSTLSSSFQIRHGMPSPEPPSGSSTTKSSSSLKQATLNACPYRPGLDVRKLYTAEANCKHASFSAFERQQMMYGNPNSLMSNPNSNVEQALRNTNSVLHSVACEHFEKPSIRTRRWVSIGVEQGSSNMIVLPQL